MAGRSNKNRGPNAIAGKYGLFLSIWSITSQTGVAFKGFLTSFKDNFNTELEAFTFVGHPQPYRKQKTTERTVDLAFDIPAYGLEEAQQNLQSVGALAKMLHPAGMQTKDGQNIIIPGGDPMFKIRFLNFLVAGDVGNKVGVANAKSTGIRGYIDSLSYEFVLDAEGGGFIGDHNAALEDPQAFKRANVNWASPKSVKKGFMYPKLIRVSFTFYPFETKPLLWDVGEDLDKPVFSRENFPYAFPKGFVYNNTSAAPPGVQVDTVQDARDNSVLGKE